MSTLSPYRVNSYRRLCDICGRPRQIEQIRFSDGVAICNIHPQYRTAQQLNKINSRVRVPKVLPVPHPKAFVPLDTYQAAESQIFNFIGSLGIVGATGSINVTENPGRQLAAGRTWQSRTEVDRYLAAFILENKRPASWIALAKSRLAQSLTQLVATFQTKTSTDLALGGLSRALLGTENTYACEDTASFGLALLAGYSALGAKSYLAAAKLCAHFLRNAQSGHLLTTAPSSSDAAGTTRKYLGGWTNKMTSSGVPRFDHLYYPSSLICLQFLTELLAVTGDITVGATDTASGMLTGPCAQSLSQSIADGRAFWLSGALDVASGTTFTGLSAATPREAFNSYPAVKFSVTGTGSWEYQDAGAATGTLISGINWARGLAALYAVDGMSAQVTALYDYLMSFGSNTAFELPANAGLAVIQRGQAGRYDPTIAPATLLKVRTGSPLAATKVNGSSFYDWSAAGMLAPIQSVRDRVAFQAAKEELSLPRQRFAEGRERDGETLYLGPLGISGLSFQPWSTATTRVQDTTRAAQVGNFYRYSPQAFTGQGH